MHLKIINISDQYPTRKKTLTFAVYSIHDDTLLGEIMWYAQWRQYVLEPSRRTVWSHDCLREVSIFIKELMLGRKHVIVERKCPKCNQLILTFSDSLDDTCADCTRKSK